MKPETLDSNSSAKLVSLRSLASLLGKSESSLRYHLRMGRITPAAKFGRTYSFDPEDVLRQLKRGVRENAK